MPPSGFKFLAPNELDKMSEQQKANQTSEYRVLNQAGVSLFDHFLTQSDELWVLFIERCTATHAVAQTLEFSFRTNRPRCSCQSLCQAHLHTLFMCRC